MCQYTYKTLVRNLSIKSHLQDIGIDKSVTLRLILGMYGVIFELDYFCFEQSRVTCFYEHGNEISCFM